MGIVEKFNLFHQHCHPAPYHVWPNGTLCSSLPLIFVISSKADIPWLSGFERISTADQFALRLQSKVIRGNPTRGCQTYSYSSHPSRWCVAEHAELGSATDLGLISLGFTLQLGDCPWRCCCLIITHYAPHNYANQQVWHLMVSSSPGLMTNVQNFIIFQLFYVDREKNHRGPENQWI